MTDVADRFVTDVADRAAAAFASRFGAEPAGVWGAPGRANLIGEHTDYNDGYVLPFALTRLTAVAAAPAPAASADTWTVYSESTDELVTFDPAGLTPGGVSGWAGYPAGVVWALRAAGYRPPAARLAIASDVPLGAGLSSSAALECAVLAALVDLGGLALPATDWPRLAQRAENEYVGMPCGIMDQAAAVLCRTGAALFLDCRSGEARQVPFDPAAAAMAVLLIDTKAPHRLVAGEYARRRQGCEAAAAMLGVPALRDIHPDALPGALGRLDGDEPRRLVRHVVTENQRVRDTVAVLESGTPPGADPDALRAIGPLLTASHASLRDDYAVSVPEVDTAVEAALAAGAYGARMIGGGFGGCVLALVDAHRCDTVTGSVSAAYADAGFAPPSGFVVLPADGARRLR